MQMVCLAIVSYCICVIANMYVRSKSEETGNPALEHPHHAVFSVNIANQMKEVVVVR